MGDPNSSGNQAETTNNTTTPPQGQPAEVHVDAPSTAPAKDPEPDPKPEPVAKPDEGQGGGRVVPVAESAFKRLKEEQREKGRKEGRQSALEEFARDHGFESVDAMQAAFKRREERLKGKGSNGTPTKKRRAKPAPVAEADPADGAADDGDAKRQAREYRRLERRLAESDGKAEELAARMQREAAKRKRAERDRDALEAEMAVRVAAAQVGIRDPDYAMRLLSKELHGKGEDDLKQFDEVKYFEGLRETHPYLFGEVSRPATTGNGAGTAPSAPNPGAAQAGAAQGGKVDARQMSREDYLKHLQSRGLSLSV